MKNSEKISNAIFSKMGKNPSNKEIAFAVESGLNTSAKAGLDQQIAVIEMIQLMNPLTDKYAIFHKGSLKYGIGENFQSSLFKKSEKSSTEGNGWIPSGPLQELEKIQSTSTGLIERFVRNDYSVIKMQELVRNPQAFNWLIAQEISAGPDAQARERILLSRYLFGIDMDANLIATDYYVQLDKVKKVLDTNIIDMGIAKDYKDVINKINEFAPEYYNNASDKYNAGNDQTKTTGTIWLDGVDTELKLVYNTASMENTVLIISYKLKNKLQQELGNTYNPAYWTDFTNQFGTVIIDTFTDELSIRILDKDTLGMKNMFDEYTNTYYPLPSAFNTITKWREHWFIIPYKNAFTLKFAFAPVNPAKDNK